MSQVFPRLMHTSLLCFLVSAAHVRPAHILASAGTEIGRLHVSHPSQRTWSSTTASLQKWGFFPSLHAPQHAPQWTQALCQPLYTLPGQGAVLLKARTEVTIMLHPECVETQNCGSSWGALRTAAELRRILVVKQCQILCGGCMSAHCRVWISAASYMSH